MKKTAAIGVGICLMVILFFAYYVSDTISRSTEAGEGVAEKGGFLDPLLGLSDYSAVTEHWESRISDAGAEAAYEEFKTLYRELVPGMQHTMAHIFGVALYDTEGLSGVAVCDEDFLYGCYHSFFATAIQNEGTDILGELDTICARKYEDGAYLGCQHGIGHGILSYVGKEDLVEALDLCTTIPWQEIGGCSGGVFMEYNFNFLGSNDSAKIRERGESLHEPCDDLPAIHQPSCYAELPQWWHYVIPDDYEKMGDLCEEISAQDQQNICYGAIGRFALNYTDYDVPETVHRCRSIRSEEGYIRCVVGAAQSTETVPNGDELGRRLCAVFDESDKADCLAKLNN